MVYLLVIFFLFVFGVFWRGGGWGGSPGGSHTPQSDPALRLNKAIAFPLLKLPLPCCGECRCRVWGYEASFPLAKPTGSRAPLSLQRGFENRSNQSLPMGAAVPLSDKGIGQQPASLYIKSRCG
ncbi:hypothetical protein XENTR_v10017273 [Xenopus tropicalis]|nr:hypothetical protein XENTR_v10017273 [Xenopus tropicalis]